MVKGEKGGKRKGNIVHWKLKKQINENKNKNKNKTKLIDTDNRLLVVRGEGSEGYVK